MKKRISAQEILDRYGVTSPEEIDLEAIAYHEGADVRYQRIQGSEARLMGIGDRAIITIDTKSNAARQRFSLAHELGHWTSDRGMVGKLCKREDIGANQTSNKTDWTEVAANKFASELLMPIALFRRSSQNQQINFTTVANLKSEYRTSLMATALRLIDTDNLPCALAYSAGGRIQWMKKSKSVPKSFWYNKTVGQGALASNLSSGEIMKDVLASEWFSMAESENYYVKESSISYWGGILTLIWWEDESQILDFSG